MVAQTGRITTKDVAELAAAGATVRTDEPGALVVEFKEGSFRTVDEFLATKGHLLGVTGDVRLREARTTTDVGGGTFRRMVQIISGARVLGGEATFKLSGTGAPLRLVANLALPENTAPAPAPNFSRAELEAIAVSSLQTHYRYVADWNVEIGERLWTSRNPWAETAPLQLTRKFIVTEPGDIRGHAVYVSETTGKPVFDHRLHCNLTRELYHEDNIVDSLQWSEGDLFPDTLDAEDQEMILATADVYNLFNRTFGRDSYDGAGATMQMITRGTNDCPNAFGGRGVVKHCPGVVSDDIVAHEWTHNYTDSMSTLIYRFESGAIDEAYSDIFGELVDLLNDRGTDAGEEDLRAGCDDDGVRWQIGEDATAPELTLPIRDMHTPECKSHPSSRSSADFLCVDGSIDRGGVHVNSGVVNRAFTLLVDGGTLNGTTITGIGMVKAVHLFYHAMFNYVGQRTDFRSLADMLQLSGEDLVGVSLPELTVLDLAVGFSSEVITAADLQQITAALTATGMLEPNDCPTVPNLMPDPPVGCQADVDLVSEVLLQQDWETSTGGWQLTQTPVREDTWNDKPWRLTPYLPDGRPGQAMFAPNTQDGDCEDDYDDGASSITSPTFDAPPFVGEMELRFDHSFSIERNFDGGVLQISLNGGPFEHVPNDAFLFNGYNRQLAPRGTSTNPFAGEYSFSGADENRLTGSWGTSVVDLIAAGVNDRDRVALRWSLTTDGCEGWIGWYVDDIVVTSCRLIPLPTELTELRATVDKQDVRLDWSVNVESDVRKFFVERRDEDRASFAEIGAVSAATTGGRGEYVFRDVGLTAGHTYFYRLRQVGRAGPAVYSSVVAAGIEGSRLRVYPNPVAEVLIIQTDVHAEAVLSDLAGRVVARRAVSNGRAELVVAGLLPGAYLLRVGSEVRRVIVR